MKLKCDEPLTNFAFNFNLRRYDKERLEKQATDAAVAKVRRRRLTVSKPVLKAPMVLAFETIIIS